MRHGRPCTEATPQKRGSEGRPHIPPASRVSAARAMLPSCPEALRAGTGVGPGS